MAKAYECDVCGKIYKGVSEIQISLSQGLEMVLRFVLGLKFSPENEEAPTYIKDLCPECAKSFTIWYKATRAGVIVGAMSNG